MPGGEAVILIRVLTGAALVAACLWLLDSRDVAERLSGADLPWLAAAIASLLAQTVLMALRWRLFARCLGTEMTAAHAIREYLAGQLLNATLPGGVLGDAARAARARSPASGFRGAAQAVVIERAAGQVGLAVVAGIGLAASMLVPGGFAPPPLLAGAMAAGLAAIALLLAGLVWRGGTGALARRCLPSRGVAGTQVALSLGAAALNVAAFAACARATGTDLGLGAALVLVPLILTAMLVPLTVGGWGWREGAAAALFPLAGAAPGAGVAAGIAFGAAIMLSVLPAAGLAICGRMSGGVRPIVVGAERQGPE